MITSKCVIQCMNPSIHTADKMFYNNAKCLSISLLNDKK